MAEPGRPSDASLVWTQIRYQNRIFWRTPVAAFFTIVFPLFFLLIFTALFGNDPIPELGVTNAQFYAPALAVFGAVSATYTNLSIGTAIARDEGLLKRVRGTPLPPWIYVAGRVGSGVYLAAISVVLMLGIGVVLYDVELIVRTLPAVIIAFVVGVACFAALGMLVAALSPSGEAAPAVANATLLPLAFISDIFIPPGQGTPQWIRTLADVFPLKHFAVAFGDAFNPAISGSGFQWDRLAVMAAWGIVGGFLAVRFFRWEPRIPSAGGGRRRRSRASA